MVKEYDVIVIGAGSGLRVSSAASALGLRVAVVEEGPMGGTCLNRGCIPSKMLIHHADVMETIQRSSVFGISVGDVRVHWKNVVERTTTLVDGEAREIEEGIRSDENTTLYKTRGVFIGERTLQVGSDVIKGKKIIIAAGTRPSVPPVAGLDRVPYITSDQALRLEKQPKTLTIIGGGYIAAELAHFFGALGTKVTIIQRDEFLVPNEDKAISAAFTRIFSKKHTVITGHATIKVEKRGKSVFTTAVPITGGKEKVVESEQLLVAIGRVPNTDLLDVVKAGIRVNKFGYVVTNDMLETPVKNVWALGDIAGKYLFKHSANYEAEYVVQNALHGKKSAVDYTAMPHAIFSSPQIAGVGEKERDLVARKADYVVGQYDYIKTGMGAALDDRDGFVRVYADKKTRKILGCHIMGSDASTLIHEVILAMKMGLRVDDVLRTIHIHPALPEVVHRAFGAIEW